jgi:MSHA pilin protein MshA
MSDMMVQRFRQRGFTLIELVVVIAIIAVLAAVALPRLIDAQHDARVAKAKAIQGSLRSAMSMARARCELDLTGSAPSAGDDCRSTPPVVLMDGHPVSIVNRFPAARADGIDVAADIHPGADGLLVGIGTATNSLGMEVPSRTFDIEGGNAPNCRISYLEAALKGAVVVGAEVRAVTDGC